MPKADKFHVVPSGYWKVISIQGQSQTRTATFIFDQSTERTVKYCDLAVSLSNVHTRAGLVFLRELPSSISLSKSLLTDICL